MRPPASNRKTTPKRDYSKPPPSYQRKAPPKKDTLETTQKDEIKTMFMNWFKSSRAVAGHVMSKENVIKNVLKRIDPKQDRPFQKAMEELVNDGLIDVKEDGVTLVLTEKGADLL